MPNELKHKARYIDAEVFAERLMNAWDTADEQKRADVVAVMANIVTPILVGTPTADVAEVKHGYWDTTDTILGRCCICSVCGSCPTMEYRYCPYCGAKMDGGK